MTHLVQSGGLDALKADPFVDITVICKDKEWVVHKTYLCGKSQAMTNHCTRMREVTEGRVYFPDDKPAAIERLLNFQYTSSYCDTDTLPTSLSGSLLRPELRCRYGPPGPPFAPAISRGGLFGPPPLQRHYAPVDKTDPVNNAPQ